MNRNVYALAVTGLWLVIIIISLLLPDSITGPLRQKTMDILGPVLLVVEKPVNFFTHMDSKLKTLDEAQAEVTRLTAEVDKLTVQNQVLTDRATENARLREMLGFREASPYHLLPCRIFSRDPSSWWYSVEVNVGWANDPLLKPDQPVVSPRGVVGKTGEVSEYTTKVILLVDTNCSISALIDGTHDNGIAQGQGNFEEGKPDIKVTYLPKDSQVTVGQFVVTSGLGPYFPAGLRIGTVTEVPPIENKYPTFGLYREALVEPTADLNQLDELFIVLGPKQQADAPPPP